MPKVRVLIVEDSAVVRELLCHIIGSDPRLEVAAAARTAEEALRLLPRLTPDVISMDIRLPGMNGLEATQRIMAEQPTPIVVIAASVQAEDLNIAMNALKAGALTVLEKPVGTSHEDYQEIANRICTQLYIMSDVPVIRQRGGRAALTTEPPARSWAPPAAPASPVAFKPASFRMLGVTASTGGPNALVQLLQGLGSEFPLPVLVVQHITPSFHGGFVRWLDSVVPQSVRVAAHGDRPEPGTVYVSPPDRHLVVGREGLRLDDSPAIGLQRPSGTLLFSSMATALGSRGLGVLLTGMGDDGADGLVALRKAGGYTLAEDASTAVVYGMPAAAAERGGVNELLPLPAIGARLVALCTGTGRGER
ncbi:MAG: cheB [Armatimonadetes bacterium]|nr:cheB [Armatimonadota bacterium]